MCTTGVKDNDDDEQCSTSRDSVDTVHEFSNAGKDTRITVEHSNSDDTSDGQVGPYVIPARRNQRVSNQANSLRPERNHRPPKWMTTGDWKT
ncbi:hypothetical protein DPMN_160167 [Dreissena polymorpha]|uniref:Uncharacterized protein n=1 Tax=Dreissena polymorpha TaxID=45954 RepID=A0A9D4IRD7_DREPO|nr:hypothetical protein DPMN_160167 [Dreissena polymorpha]